MSLIKHTDEVFYTDAKVVKVNAGDIHLLKQHAMAAERKRARLCTHQDERSPLHEMLIVHHKNTYVRPHKHPGKSESFHIIEGEADVFIFDDNGKVMEKIEMGSYASGKIFFYRLSEAFHHTLLIRTDTVVFHETTNGPFLRGGTVFAEWAPVESTGDSMNFLYYLESMSGIQR